MGRLFWKFFVCILLAQLTATVGIGGAVWLKNRSQPTNQASDLDTSPPAELAIASAAATLEFGGVQALRRLLVSMERHRVYAVDEQGHELLQREVSAAMLRSSRLLLKQQDQRHSVRQVSDPSGQRYVLFLPAHGLELSGPLMDEPGLRPAADGARGELGEPRGPHTPPDPRDPRFHPLRLWVPIAAATLASLLCSMLLAWYFSGPIRALRLAFDAVAGGDLAPRFGAVGNGKRRLELDNLGRDFDRMTARLRSLIEGQTRLLHDVSHELRSPLARLQAAIGLAHQQPDKLAASLERIERESVRMDKLVGELLTLARLEAGAIQASEEDISMAELLEAIVDDANYEANSQQCSVQQAGEAEVQVSGQAQLLGRAIENVVRNAIKHTPDGGVVQLQTRIVQGGRQLTIQVLDRGPGVAEAELDTIFQPFFRSSQASTDGHGLGLAIARQVILAHGGTIKATNRDGGGLCVELSLPVKT